MRVFDRRDRNNINDYEPIKTKHVATAIASSDGWTGTPVAVVREVSDQISVNCSKKSNVPRFSSPLIMFLRRSVRLTSALARKLLNEQRKVIIAGVQVQARRQQNGAGSGQHGQERRSGFHFRPFTVPLALSGALLFTLDHASNERPDPVASKILKAAKCGDVASVERLLSAGEGVNARHPLGWGALHVAAINGRREVVRALLQAGVDPNLPEEYINIYNTAREKGMHSLGTLLR